jgi:hypothetical protein
MNPYFWTSTTWVGWLSNMLLFAAPIALAGVYFISHRFRRAVAKSMSMAAKAPTQQDSEPTPVKVASAQGSLRLRILRLNAEQAKSDERLPAQQIGRANLRQLLAVNVWAGLVYVLVTMILYLPQTGGFALAKALVMVAMFSPPLTAAVMIAGNFGYRLLFLALGIHLVLLEGLLRFFGVGRWSDPFDLILIPTLTLLVLSSRRLRAVGPMMYWGVTAVLCTTSIGFVYAGSHLIKVLGVHFVDPQLATLPLPVAAQQWLNSLTSLPPGQLLLKLFEVVNDPLSLLTLKHQERVTGWLIAGFHLGVLVGFAMGATIAWIAFRWFANRYRDRRASDQMLEIEFWWVGFTLVLGMYASLSYGWFGIVALAPLVAYYAAMHFGLRWVGSHRPITSPARLLLLRVFGFDKRTQRLLDRVGSQWRFLAPIKLIAGPDLAHSQMEPHEFFNFTTGHVSREFIRSDDDLKQRLRTSEEGMDPDGRYRIHEFFCHDNTWRLAVTHLMKVADAVLMDLRGFSRANAGCKFEIEQLVQSVALEKVLLIVDKTTDCDFLNRVVQNIWTILPLSSPKACNQTKQLTLVEISRDSHRTVDALLKTLR